MGTLEPDPERPTWGLPRELLMNPERINTGGGDLSHMEEATIKDWKRRDARRCICLVVCRQADCGSAGCG